MRRIKTGIVLAASVCLAGCGARTHFADQPRPPSPVNLTVYINDQRVSVSPTSVGAGPVVFIVTNQSSQSEGLTVLPAGTGAAQPLADTGPISPQATAQVTVDFSTPGDYTVTTSNTATTDAAAAVPKVIRPALLHIGPERASASGQLLSP